MRRSNKRYGFAGLSGCVIQTTSRRTGTLVGLYHAEQAQLDAGEHTWLLVCETHHTCVGIQSLAIAKDHMPAPDDWCDYCRELMEAKDHADP